MKRLTLCVLACLAGALPARAHFLWVLPADANARVVRVVFSDAPRPDDPALLKKVAHTQLLCRTGVRVPGTGLTTVVGKDALQAALSGTGFREVAAVCHYGVAQHGKSEPFLLNYYAKGFAGLEAAWGNPPELVFRPWEEALALEIVPLQRDDAVCVLWQGKPLPGAEVVLVPPGKDKPVEGKTDEQGRFKLPRRTAGGTWGIRARHVEAKAGEHGGKTYKEVRHYATMTVALPERRTQAEVQARPQVQVQGKVKPPAVVRGAAPAADKPADPEATRLFAEARAARAVWHDFPGFTADVEINLDGKTTRAHATVSDKGKVKLEPASDGADNAALAWARGQLASVVGHRLGGGTAEETPCSFADDDTTHPLGRAVKVQSDEFDSGYRIRDRQLMVVQRRMRDSRFTITMLENRRTADGKFLPVSYVVNTWDLAGGRLKGSEAFHQTWQQVGPFELPAGLLVVSSADGKQQARGLTLSNVRLLAK
jgi:hypothetical protein